MSTPAPSQRPGTVTAACIILFIGAALGLFAGCTLLVASGSGDAIQGVELDSGVLTGLGAITAIIAVVQLVLAILLWRGSNGARLALIVLQVIDIGLSVLTFDLSAILGIAVSVVIVVLLLNPATKAYTGVR